MAGIRRKAIVGRTEPVAKARLHIARGELGKVFGKEMSRDTVTALKRASMIAAGPRSPQPGGPYSYVTTGKFLSVFGLASLRDLPDIEQLEDAGEIPFGIGDGPDEEDSSGDTIDDPEAAEGLEP